MSTVLDSLLRGTNGLLESPTGTGKTLCLLCSCLAWQRTHFNAVEPISLEHATSNTTKSSQIVIPKSQPSIIIYASRTHNQLSQVVAELKSTAYRPRMSVLGSREQLCINSKYNMMKGSALNHACNAANAQRKCMFKNNLESYIGGVQGVGEAASPILDIEQIVDVGKSDHICPYFYSRDNAEKAELILVPYNYLLESSIRATLKVEWKNAVVIFDEAHNLERVASDAASCTLSSTDLAQCILELQHVLKLLQLENSTLLQQPDSAGGNMKRNMMSDAPKSKGKSDRPNLQRTAKILKSIFDVEQRLDSIPLAQNGLGSAPSCVLPGHWLVDMLEAAGIHATEVSPVIANISLTYLSRLHVLPPHAYEPVAPVHL